jgi:hypothetical protein
LHVIDVCIARNQLHVGVCKERREETADAIEAFACSRQILDLAHHLRLPVLRARLTLAQFDETAVEQQ